jgi:aquaporin NIP
VDRSMAQIGLAEFLGTFLLVFAGPGAVVIEAVSNGGVTPVGIGLSFGLAVMAAIVIFGTISGAHINPAVSLAFASQGLLAWSMLPLYVGSQLAGAAGASAVHLVLFGNEANLGATLPTGSDGQALLLEIVITFFLGLIVFSVATDGRIEPRVAAFSVGFYVALAATFSGPIAGASMNPARSFGPSLVSGVWESQWLYWLGPIAGALGGAYVFRFLKPVASEVKDVRRERVA